MRRLLYWLKQPIKSPWGFTALDWLTVLAIILTLAAICGVDLRGGSIQ